MKIEFEKWLEANDIPEEALILFEEAINCYKISAYRSSFIMSYIAFQNILKSRILQSTNSPTGIDMNWWTRICADLGDEDKWDNTVVDCVKRNNPDRVFLIDAASVTEYESYRVIRNKCAHGKTGKIEYYHVESFWNYIKENFYRFSINGGKIGLLQDIQNHYDKTITPPNSDIKYIIDRIKLGILDADLNEFIKNVYDFCKNESSVYYNVFSAHNKFIDLWDALVNSSNERIQNAIIEFIKKERPEDTCEFVGRYPSTTDKFLSDGAFARKLWTGLLKECDYDNIGLWNLLEKIVINDMVPDAEKPDFDNLLFSILGKYFPEEKIDILNKTNYFSKLEKSLFDANNYKNSNGINYANSVAGAFKHYINEFGLSVESVICINVIFSFATYGPFYSAIRTLMKQDDTLLDYQKIVQENNLGDFSEKFRNEDS